MNRCKMCDHPLPRKIERRGARADFCSDRCVKDRLEQFKAYDLARCFTCNGEFIGKKKGNQRYCTPECTAKGEKLYHALYDSLEEQLQRRRAYMESKKHAKT